jgi:hypothetical protein
MTSKNDYFGLGYLISLVLAIIPLTCWICGVITRFNEGKIVSALIRVFLGFNVIWILDIVYIVSNGSIFRALEI